MENEFPPNSHTQRDARPSRPAKAPSEKKEVKRVIAGKVIQRKKPLYRKFIDAFRPEDNKGFGEYILLDVLAPGIKDVVADSATTAIENALGVDRARGRRRGGGGYTSYSGMSGARPRSSSRSREDDRRPGRREPAGPSNVREIILETRAEAETVLDELIELMSKYDVATVRDLLSLLGVRHEFTDEDWGWTDLRGSRIHRVGGGYLLDLPRPVALD